ncbi:ABC transporter ATP-binding protein [Periweissella cryptocerci]|uniref:ABC transporter ATP-binding protein n=1 Tax=Periweissella cryptocerci TaxID=2506420 RepID=A0A4P6YT97_9LACO|nr:ABC transporter ATP-binding protein [Periweissella cryptocerci]QBO35964.1 ABC transporter ATP-binding protein [Periweissella cryptocerci]
MDNALQLRNIAKSFAGNTLFENVNLTVTTGEIVALVGPNGVGKSVLLKIIAGFIAPDKGDLTVLDKERNIHAKQFDAEIGIVIDKPAFNPAKTGFDNLHDLASINNIITSDKIATVMTTMGLDRHNHTKVKNYSLGMKKKLAISQAFMENQRLILLDEPFNGLDAQSILNLRQLMLELKAEGKTIIFTSHIQADIDFLADEIYEFNNQTILKKELQHE